LANSRSARKRIRADLRKRERNRGVRSAVRTRISTARKALLSGESVNVEDALRAAVRELDRAGEKGILHRNNVRRRKSRLTAMASRIMRLAEGSEDAVAARAAAAGGEKGRSAKGGAKTKTKTAAKPKAAAKKTTAKTK
jgi:small subunit ribosomal protein S20